MGHRNNRGKLVKSDTRQQATYPDRKISETFLDFASPLLAIMPDDATEASVEKVLSIAYVVWNSVVLDDINGNDCYMAKLKEPMASDPVPAALVTELTHRKRTLFADDQRLIGKYKVRRKQGELNLWAEARDPYPVPRAKGHGRKGKNRRKDSKA